MGCVLQRKTACQNLLPVHINDQYYITTFGDPHEVFANWRRSGYPVLTPAVMAKEDGQCATASDGYSIPRRFI